ncbi:hypothetical protein [Aliivibrio fischeri]|uniref:hypothetical protein n=1 Tax=Aliivibrio fischeri TaxID=668 RepID=UPI00080DA776|nr:hypothetical protein [Aliivibrio fischeri]OCH47855.1 hypothetical protein A6E02_19620 [Aliivibrio fischeri]
MIAPIQDKEWVHPLSLILLREGNMSNNNEKVMEISHSDVINALFHQKLHEQHFATQESVDNLKERFLDFSARTDSNFEKVDAEFKEVRAEIKEVRTEIKDLSNKTDENFKELSNRMDDKFRWVIGTMCSGFIAMLAVMLAQIFTQ